MRYINPFDLLELETVDLSTITASIVNKAKRKLLVEIELSDTNTIKHNGIELTKSDCIRAIDDLDNKDKREFHFFIFQNKYLKEFLSECKIGFFENYKAESIYKLPEFLNFISPFFTKQYDKLLALNFKSGHTENVFKILSVKQITNEEYYEKCYNSTYTLLRNINNEIEKINSEIEANNSSFIDNNFIELGQTISNKVNIPLLNTLPTYFKSIRNQLAQTINELSTTINNDPYKSYEAAFNIIELAKSISTDGLASQKITKDYYIVKKNYEGVISRKEEENQAKQYTKEFAYYNDLISQVDNIIEEIDNKKSKYISKNFSGLLKWIETHISISELNSLPDIFINIRIRFAVRLKHLSVAIWNEYKKISPSVKLIQLALTIKVDNETKAEIEKNYETLKNNEEQIKENGKPIKSAPSLSWTDGTGHIIYGDTLYFGIAHFPIFPIARYSLEYDGMDSYTFFGRLKMHWWQKLWNFSLISIILFLIILAIVDNINTKKHYESFKIKENGFTNIFPINKNNETILRTKILPIDMDNKTIDDIYTDLPDFLRPDSLSEVKSLVQIWRKSKQVGRYKDNRKAMKNYCIIKIIDLETKTQVYEGVVNGSDPPNKKRGGSDAYGSSPNKYVIRFLRQVPNN